MLKLGWWEELATHGAINITKIEIIVTRIFACRITAHLINLKDPSSMCYSIPELSYHVTMVAVY